MSGQKSSEQPNPTAGSLELWLSRTVGPQRIDKSGVTSKCIIDAPCITEGKEPTLIYKKKAENTSNAVSATGNKRLGLDVG